MHIRELDKRNKARSKGLIEQLDNASSYSCMVLPKCFPYQSAVSAAAVDREVVSSEYLQ